MYLSIVTSLSNSLMSIWFNDVSHFQLKLIPVSLSPLVVRSCHCHSNRNMEFVNWNCESNLSVFMSAYPTAASETIV